MFLSKENLSVHLVASNEAARYALTGILVDPKRNVTAASDGKRLVEVSTPSIDPGTYPVRGVRLANGNAQPFILPVKTAQEIARILPKGKDDADPTRYAALVTGPDGKVSIVTTDGKRSHSFSFDPIEGTFPDYQGSSIFPTEEPIGSLVVNPTLLGSTLKAATLGDSMRLKLYKDRVILDAEADDGTKSRGVLMGQTDKSAAARPSEPGPEPRSSEAETASPTPAPPEESPKQGGCRGFRKWKRGSVEPPVAIGQPSVVQRALYAYLARTRGESVTAQHLAAGDIAAKIDVLKKRAVKNDSFASWPQWRKLFIALVEKKASPKVMCRVLNGLTDSKTTYVVVGKWLAKDTPAASDAA